MKENTTTLMEEAAHEENITSEAVESSTEVKSAPATPEDGVQVKEESEAMPVAEESSAEKKPESEAPEKEKPAAENSAPDAPEEEAKQEVEKSEEGSEQEISAKEKSEETPETQQEGTQEQKARITPDYSAMSLSDILLAFRQMLERGDQQELYKNSEIIKASFYKVLRRERVASGMFVSPGADTATSDNGEEKNPFDAVEKAFKDLYSEYKVSRSAYTKELQRVKEENLAIKLEVIDGINKLLEKAEDLNHTFPQFRELQKRWKEAGSVPQEKSKELTDSYNSALERFYDFIKLNKEYRDLDFSRNLDAKTKLCEEAEALVDVKDKVKAFNELQKLHAEWKELGPVAKDKREAIWERFKEATSKINKSHQEYYDNLAKEHKKNLEAKTKLCEEAEAIANTESDSIAWKTLSKRIEELRATWRTIGFASKKENQKIYDRFRAACNKFYAARKEYFAKFKEVLQENLRLKEQLCEEAEAIKESTEWAKATDKLIDLQKRWKAIGPVARKQNEAIWSRFRAACDGFFSNKAKHFGEDREELLANLSAKKALIEEIKAYVPQGGDEDKAALESFHERWSGIGHVPFKEKEAINKEYEEALNLHFKEIRDVNTERQMGRLRRLIADAKNSDNGEKSIRFERDKLLNKFHKLEQEIATLENNVGFFAKSDKADKLVGNLQKRIEAGKEELKVLMQKIKFIEKEF